MKTCWLDIGWRSRGSWQLALAVVFVTTFLQVDLSRGQENCGNTTCSKGSCCSQSGYCGSTVAYCGCGCTSGDCWSNNTCSSGRCCSHSNYCGSDAEFCGCGCKGGPCFTNLTSSFCSAHPIGSCINNLCVDSFAGQCCSQNNYCGSNGSYCGSGCKGGPCYNSSAGKSLPVGAIAGIAIAGSAGMIMLVVILFVKWSTLITRCKRRRDEDSREDTFKIERRLRRLCMAELEKATDFGHKIGEGKFGVVYKGTLDDGTKIAVKKLKNRLSTENGVRQKVRDFEAEVKTLGSINQVNLVSLLGFTIDGDQLFLIYEFVGRGSLYTNLRPKDRSITNFVLPWETRVNILQGTARGLAYLHKELQGGRTIVHLDLKPANILLDESFVPKIADFGLARLLRLEGSTETLANGGTYGYMAPEILDPAPASPKMDVYSFGMVMLEVVSGRKLYVADLSPLQLWAKDKVREGAPLDFVDPLLAEKEQIDENSVMSLMFIALRCLQRDPNQRPEMSDVLRMMEGSINPGKDLPPPLQADLEMVERPRISTTISRDNSDEDALISRR